MLVAELFRTLDELRSLLAAPANNVEAARKIVDDLCREARIPEMPAAASTASSKVDK
jgi:hypothetical protein